MEKSGLLQKAVRPDMMKHVLRVRTQMVEVMYNLNLSESHRVKLYIWTLLTQGSKGGDGEGTVSETLSLVSYTLRFVILPVWVVITDTPVYRRERGGGDGVTGRERFQKIYLCCHTHSDTSVS